MANGNVISIRDVLERAMRRTGQSDDEDTQPILKVEDCGDGYAYLTMGRRLPWQDAVAILNEYYGHPL